MLQFTNWQEFRDWAVGEGHDPQKAYKAWRKAWLPAVTGFDWEYLATRPKGANRHYADASTSTEVIAT